MPGKRTDEPGANGLRWLTTPVALRLEAVLLLGTALVAASAVVSTNLGSQTDRTIPALLLVVPVVVAGSLGGRRIAFLVAGEAAVALTFFLPPRGTVRVHATEDLVALSVFVIVAIVTGRLVAYVIDLQLQRAAMLEEIETQRRGLLRAVSHDLRTPLTVIRATASALSTAPLPEASRGELLQLISDEADRLDRLVSNLLNMSRIEAGALRLSFQPVDVGHLVESSLVRLRRLTRDVAIEADVADDLPLVDADSVQLEQVVTNLLENAVRHSPPGGEVIVRVNRHPAGVSVSVADEGPGLPNVDPALLFAPFTVVGQSGSSGVGLAICRAVIEEHGGTISGANRAGIGAQFQFVIPARQDPDSRRR
jgi:K+-sensing histidine kinase KdpD